MLEVEDLTEVNRFLGIGIMYDDDEGYHLEQAQSIREILTNLHLEQANPARTNIGEEQDGEDEVEISSSGNVGTAEPPPSRCFSQ